MQREVCTTLGGRLPALAALCPLLASLCLLLASPLAAAGQPPDPWALLAAVRGELVTHGFQQAEFEQTYVPAGFTQGETETGRLALGLPDCLRWDYGEPYPKSFLVCGEVASYWNPEDGTGRRQGIDRENEPGLDLLLLPTEELAARYEARLAEGDGGAGEAGAAGEAGEDRETARIVLTPRQGGGQVREAILSVDRAAGTVVELSFTDHEGNLTRFRIGAYGPIRDPNLFSPPPGITWVEEEPPR